MSALDTQPQNLNLLASTGFKFFIKKLPTTNFFVQSVNIPGIKLAFTEQVTPFLNINYYGDKLVYNDFAVSFAVDEDMRNYLELRTWLEGLGRPVNFDQRQKLEQKEGISEGKRSDCTIVTSSNNKVPSIEIQIQDAFPISVTDLTFSSTQTSESYLLATATFKYTNITIKKI